MKAKRAAIAARFTIFIKATALCAFPQTLRREDGIVRARVWARW
jgi:hypothetical protein